MTPPEMTIFELIGWIVLGGSIGGVTAMLIKVKVVKDGLLLDEIKVQLRSFVALAVISLFIGSTAALAIQWFLIGFGGFRSKPEIEDTMFILAISIIAGFGGRRLLPMITSQLEKQIRNVEEGLEKTKKEAEVATDKVTERQSKRRKPITPGFRCSYKSNTIDLRAKTLLLLLLSESGDHSSVVCANK